MAVQVSVTEDPMSTLSGGLAVEVTVGLGTKAQNEEIS